VYICGSTAKKLDRAHSDLETMCVVKDGLGVPSKRLVYNGLLVGVDYPQDSTYLKAARKPGHDWPLGADECRNHIVLFDRDGWMRKLAEAVAENDRTDFTEAIRFAALVMTESLAAVCNADLKHDQMDLRTRAFYMAWDTARVVFLLNESTCSQLAGSGSDCSNAQSSPVISRGSSKLSEGSLNPLRVN